jgi:hypothetical protein
MSDPTEPTIDDETKAARVQKPLSPEAQRALDEAAARRAALGVTQRPKELGGLDGPEPTRHGDWAHKGIASDF